METENLFKNMTTDEMKSALADREMELLDFHTTYCVLMEGCRGYDNMSEEEIEESEEELSASEKLKLLKEEDPVLAPSEEAQKSQTKEPESEESESEEVQEKPKKKRRNPPKGGSFGPTVGGF